MGGECGVFSSCGRIALSLHGESCEFVLYPGLRENVALSPHGKVLLNRQNDVRISADQILRLMVLS